ncbi:P-loop containing nucleoside triphosphate hydrolase protein [Coemansia reversa NRRL 1564]|uniref:RNA helicase n=1 Tax=Coemansia reversa (strain ATCC 12441 / NRRL 1564) TaxID=763665 RepID=A0A2G5BFS5_COERN|nr:P-loop containing nucleoside triphosphate hydrolase protein [Coemansia reversa NRRL 1564]|eukprot:PIA17876.1 P-loop containing nucleoside triphosphate hydrolase protein [Coemansia reversa NRRL 1564]
MSGSKDLDCENAIEKYRRRRRELEVEEEQRQKVGQTAEHSEEDTYLPLKQRRQERLDELRQRLRVGGGRQLQSDVSDQDGNSDHEVGQSDRGNIDRDAALGPRSNMSLLDQMAALRKKQILSEKTEEERQREQEQALLEAIARRKQLAPASELAKGVVYTQPMSTTWRPLSRHRALTAEEAIARRRLWHIIVEGEDVPPPLLTFRSMRFPTPILDYLRDKGIMQPSAIQMQGLPVALSGRDMIGIASTGTGKTMAFSLPLVMQALEEECRMPLVQGEGPVGLVVCPSRELARQTHEGLMALAGALEAGGFPELRSVLAIGGISMQEQAHTLSKGVHMVVATPGRLQDMLRRGRINLDMCRYMCMDEADRMVDVGFEDEVRDIISYFKRQRQTVLFSATMPRKIQDFARSALVKPVVVNVSRAGAANMDIIQGVEYVKPEMRVAYLLECLQKTAPPVVVFAENKHDVDDILEYLLLKGVEAVAVHGGKDQEEREYAMRSFRAGKKDVLVATDVASKGLDFPEIKHVINFDLPREIENYTHRIGRTGRAGRTGVATTFINMNSSEHEQRMLQAAQRREDVVKPTKTIDALI